MIGLKNWEYQCLLQEVLMKHYLLSQDYDVVKPEHTYGDSRFDFQILTPEGTCLLEVKGCTLEQDGLALFPDAPTQRGVKHLRGLTEYARQGGRAIVLLVIQMKGIHAFTPNRHTDPAFADAMLEAKQAGVEILALDCVVTPDSMRLDRPVKILLD